MNDTKKRYHKDVGQLIKKKTISGTKWNSTEKKLHNKFLFELGDTRRRIKQHDPLTDSNQTNAKLTSYSNYTLPLFAEKKTNTTQEEFFWAKQSHTKTAEDHRKKLFEVEKNAF